MHPNLCYVCGRGFPSREEAVIHMANHNGCPPEIKAEAEKALKKAKKKVPPA